MNDDFVINWLIKANNDMVLSKHELNLPEDQIVTVGVCFHCQQAVEKFFKAFLFSKQIEFPKTHNLEFLQQLCILQDEEFVTLEVSNLTDFAVDLRYATEFFIPSVQDAKYSYTLAL